MVTNSKRFIADRQISNRAGKEGPGNKPNQNVPPDTIQPGETSIRLSLNMMRALLVTLLVRQGS